MCKFITAFLSIVLFCSSASANDAHAASGLEVRDPTTPLGNTPIRTQAGGQQFALNSIFISSQRKLATINGKALREGELVPGSADVKVRQISSQAVVLQQADKTWVLRLSPSILKRH